jgi:hypothetical protein
MKNFIWLFLLCSSLTSLHAKIKELNSTGSSGRWIKIARIQNANPIDGSESSQFAGTVNIQTDYGQTGTQQYYAIFSFGCRGGIIPLLEEFGGASGREVADQSRIEWRIYTDTEGWHYLWFWQSNYSRFVEFDYQIVSALEYWTAENPPANFTQVWSSINGVRQYSNSTYNSIVVNQTLGIGTSIVGSHKLAVEGTIGAREIKVESSGWSDFVFEPDFDLPTLQEVENFIDQNGHLPDIPSSEDVEENGISLGEMDAKLLQKIEELTLYMIELKKENEEMKASNLELKEENQSLKIDLLKEIEIIKAQLK